MEIDYCPTCRGVWLDRGELDKIIERSEMQTAPAARPAPAAQTRSAHRERRISAAGPAAPPYQQYPAYPSSPDSPDYRGGYGQGYDPRSGQRRRKQSFLGDLFDF